MIGLIIKGLSFLGLPQGAAKIIAVGLIILTICGSIFAAYKYIDNLTNKVIAAETRAIAAEVAANKNKQALINAKQDYERNIKAINILSQNMTKIREDLDEQTEVFKKHDWDYLFQKKPGLMLTRFNTGTKQLFDSFEALSGSPSSKN